MSDALTRIKATLAGQDQQIAALTRQAQADKTASAALTKQIADLTKERDALKVSAQGFRGVVDAAKPAPAPSPLVSAKERDAPKAVAAAP